MAGPTAYNALTVAVVSIASVYMGMKFFQPLVIQQLEKDGNLRPDIAAMLKDPEVSQDVPEESLYDRLREIRDNEARGR